MYTPSKIKISMLCALALCGQVRRDDLAILRGRLTQEFARYASWKTRVSSRTKLSR